MAITWGSYNGHLRFGIDITMSTPSSSSTSITMTAKLYIQCSDDWSFNDSQSYNFSGLSGGSGSFSNTLANGEAMLLRTVTTTRAIDYDGTGGATYSATLSGAYNGATPTHSRTVTLPKRPSTIPSTPGAPTVNNPGSTTATVTWSAPGNGGSALTGVDGQVSTSSAFGSVTQSWFSAWTTSWALSGLAKGAIYYVRVRAENANGASGWSGARQFETDETVAGAPSTPTVTNIGPTTATVTWANPVDTGGGVVSQARVQWSRNSDFTSPSETLVPGTTANLSGLLPGTDYYVRVSVITAAGSGPNSPARSFTTMSGVRVGNGTDWVPGIVRVGNGTSWVLATVHVGNGTEWK